MVRPHPAEGSCPIFMVPWNQDSSPEEDGGGQEDGRTEDVSAAHRSGLQGAASPSIGKRDSRFCDPCDPASCCNALVSCGSDGAECKAGCPAGPASYGFCPCPTLGPPSPLPQVELQGIPLCCGRPHGACWSAPPWCHQSGGGHPPLLRLDAVGWALMSVASTISTSGSGASGGSAESGGPGTSDADNPEKISSKTPLSHQRRQRLSMVLWGPSAAGASTQCRLF